MDTDWEGAFEDDLSQRRPHDDHVQKVLLFVQEHESILHAIDNTVKTSVADAVNTNQVAIKVHVDHPERVFTQDLFASASDNNICNNEVLAKVVTVLVFLCDEIHELKEIAESKLYGPLVVFGQTAVEAGDVADQFTFQSGEREKMIGTFLPILQEISNFIDRCYSLATNVVQQLANLLKAKEQLYKVTFQSTHMTTVFIALGELLSVLISLDCIVQQNDVLQEAWSHYKTMISYARADPASFSTDEVGVSKFERLLVSIDQSVMIGEIFKGCIEQNFETIIEDDREVHVSVRANQIFTTELLFCLKNSLENALNIIGTGAELFERNDVMNSMALFALYRLLLPANIPPDPKLYKQLWSVQKLVPTVVICDKVVWNVGEFLQTHAPFDLKKPDPANPAAYRRTYIQQFDQTFSQRTSMLVSQCSAWMVLAESRIQPSFRHEDNVDQVLDVRSSILLKGLSLANRARYLAQSCLVMHTAMTVPMSRSSLLDIALLIENLKSIETTLSRKNTTMAEAHSHALRAIAKHITGVLAATRQRVNDGQGVNLYKADLLTAVACMELLLKGSEVLSNARQAGLQILSEIIVGSKLFGEKDGPRFRNLVARLCMVSNLPQQLQKVCDSRFLYYHLDILSPMVESIYQLSAEANRLQYLLKGFIDGIKVCQMVAHLPATPFFLNLRVFLRDCVKKNIIEPLCRDIENDLRLHIHTKHLDHMQALNPKTDTLRPLRPFLDIPPLKILGTVLSIRHEVTHYLNRSFYNLTTGMLAISVFFVAVYYTEDCLCVFSGSSRLANIFRYAIIGRGKVGFDDYGQFPAHGIARSRA
jgi:WASH complex subunit 7